jgi:WD40 repeat protein
MGGDGLEGDRAEIRLMQDGMRAALLRAAQGSGRGLRAFSPRALLSLLCAGAFSPLIPAVAGIPGIEVLAALGTHVLSGVIAGALEGRSADKRREASADDLEEEIARQIERALAAGDANAQTLRAEIAAVLEEIDAGGIALRAAIEDGSERVRSDVIAAIGMLGAGFGELGFLIKDVARAAAEIQRGLDEQGADVRAIIDQNARQSTEIRLAREDLAVIEWRTRGVLGDAVGGNQGPRWVHGCPYRGLLPFGEGDAEVFYGRERLTSELAVKLAGQLARAGLVVVTGASGAGKSSLLRAGLLPALARGMQVPGSAHWPRMLITPTRDPLTELATHLAVLGGTDTVAIRDGLAHHPDQAHLAVRQAVVSDAAGRGHEPPSRDGVPRLVLVVDQFEQAFTLNQGVGGAAERQAFITALCAAATHPAGPACVPPALVVISVRGDFWDRCAAYPELTSELQEGQFVVGPMSESDLRLAITGPADAAGLQIDPALADAVVSDLRAAAGDDTPGSLPLLSQAMLLTWENREGTRLTAHGYGQGGGVSLAVQSSADAVYEALPAGQQELARHLLRSMTVGSRDARLTRRPVSLADLHAGHSQAERSQLDTVLEAFAAKRLVVLNAGTAQISHDVLLRAWPRLRGWLEDDQASLILHGQLASDAAEWHSHNGDPSFLYRGTQLAALREATTQWSADPGRYPSLTGTQANFLQASERAAARGTRQRRMLAAALVILLIGSVVGAGIAAVAARSANQQRAAAVSGQLAAESQALDTADPVTASLLAAAAWRIDPTPQARDSTLDVLAQPDHGVLPGSLGGGPVSAVAFSPDGKTLATVGAAGKALLWDMATRHQLGAPLGEYSEVDSAAFSPDGKTLALAGAGGYARLWDVATRAPIGQPLTAGTGNNYSGTQGVSQDSVAFSHDGMTLATVSEDGTARLWDVATRHQIGAPLSGGPGRIQAVAFSPDGKILATGNFNGTVQLRDVATHARIGIPLTAGPGGVSTGPGGVDAAGPGGVDAVAFSPGGKSLAAATTAGRVRLWDLATRTPIGRPITAGRGTEGTAIAFSPDGKILATATGNGTASLWDLATRSRVGGPFTTGPDQTDAVAFSPDGKTLATAGGDGLVRLWDLAIHGEIGAPLRGSGTPFAVAFSPAGKTLATMNANGTARLLDVATNAQIGGPTEVSPDPSRASLEAAAFSPDGKILATAIVKNLNNGRGVGQLWNLATHDPIGGPLPGGADAVAFSPDGKTLATESNEGIVDLWDVATHARIGTQIRTPRNTPGPGQSGPDMAFSPDGKTLAITSGGRMVQLRDVATHARIGVLVAGNGTPDLAKVAFSPDGKALATWGAPGAVRLWDVATHAQIGAPLSADNGQVFAVAFSPDGKTLATMNADGTAELWDVATHAPIGVPLAGSPGRAAGVFGAGEVAYSPDSKTLATMNSDGTVELWNIALPSNTIKAVCAIAGRSLTHEEWNTYIHSEPFRRVCS